MRQAVSQWSASGAPPLIVDVRQTGGSPIRIPFENDTFMCPVIHPSLGYLGLALEVPHSDGRPHRWSLKLDPGPPFRSL